MSLKTSFLILATLLLMCPRQDTPVSLRPALLITKKHFFIQSGKFGTREVASAKPHVPLQIELTAPTIDVIESGSSFDLQARVYGFRFPMKNFTFTWVLPAGFEILRGHAQEDAAILQAGEEWKTSITVKGPAPGTPPLGGPLIHGIASFDGPLGRLGASQQLNTKNPQSTAQTDSPMKPADAKSANPSASTTRKVKFYQ